MASGLKPGGMGFLKECAVSSWQPIFPSVGPSDGDLLEHHTIPSGLHEPCISVAGGANCSKNKPTGFKGHSAILLSGKRSPWSVVFSSAHLLQEEVPARLEGYRLSRSVSATLSQDFSPPLLWPGPSFQV